MDLRSVMSQCIRERSEGKVDYFACEIRVRVFGRQREIVEGREKRDSRAAT